MKIALAQLNYHIGDFEYNISKNIEYLRKAKSEGVDLIVFPELSVCGYQPQDFLQYADFSERCMLAVQELSSHCKGIACIIGSPLRNTEINGKDFYNAAFLLEDGKIVDVVKKGLLPTYDVFEENRYFESNRKFHCLHFKGMKIALTICEDLWNINDNPLYTFSPMDELIKESPDFMINIAASPFSYCHDEERIAVLSANAKKYNLPLFYVNSVGAQTEIIFDGGGLVFDRAGILRAELAYFAEDMQIFEVSTILNPIEDAVQIKRASDIEQIHAALVLGIQDYFKKSGFSKAILGLSGGIDSAIVCALACEALGADNIMAVLMPSKFSSDHSINDANYLADKLGCKKELISIESVAAAFEETLAPVFKGLAPSIAEENIQARSRAILLMALSNKLGYVLLNTSNKSEVAVGYGTLYGDMCGALSVIGDVYKSQVYDLANYINRNEEIIPLNTIEKAPSAELRPDQKDADSLPDYGILDKILFNYIEKSKNEQAIIQLGFEEETVKRILTMVSKAEFKRRQGAPILKVSPKAFGTGRRMPIVAKYY